MFWGKPSTSYLMSAMVASRRSQSGTSSPYEPRLVETDQYTFKGKTGSRLRVILRGRGCSTPTCTMCPLPNQGLGDVAVNGDSLVRQLEKALERHPNCDFVSLYNDGNFFADKEIPPRARQAMLQRLRHYGCSRVFVESIPNFVTQSKIENAVNSLGDTKLTISVGLQSISDTVRRSCLNSPVRIDPFLNLVELLRQYDIGTKVYLLLKPPFLTEEEAIKDCVSSVRWVYRHGVDDISICPTRAAKGTLVSALEGMGLYNPPKLTSIVETLLQLRDLGAPVRISVFNIESSDMAATVPSGCVRCNSEIPRQLIGYNKGNDVLLDQLVCQTCKEDSLGSEIWDARISVEQRVEGFIREAGYIDCHMSKVSNR